MIGASKILTVSYGTFSCTLEGFDEPFNTMKAIAEYFRDLAADDRYFGAEPPTPDAAMLHRIAEREVQRRVEAKIHDNGVTLRAGDGAAPLAPAPITQPVPTGLLAEESVAAKLQRIRSAVSRAAIPAAPVIADAVFAKDEEDAAPLAVAAVAPTAFAPTVVDPEPVPDPVDDTPIADLRDRWEAIDEAEVAEEEAAYAAAEVDLREVFDDPEFAPVAEAEPAVTLEVAAAECAADETSAVAGADDLSDIAGGLPEDIGAPLADDLREAAMDETADDSLIAALTAADDATLAPEAEVEPEQESDPDFTDLLAEVAAAEPEAEKAQTAGQPEINLGDVDVAVAEEEIYDEDEPASNSTSADATEDEVFLDTAEDEGFATAAGPDIPDWTDDAEEFDEEPFSKAAKVPDFDSEADAEEVFQDLPDAAAAAAAMAATPAPEDASPAAEKLRRARARVIKVRRPDAPAETTAPLTDEAEAELARELAEVDKDSDAVRKAERDGRNILEKSNGDEDVTRLLRQTNTEMDVPENRRRMSTLAHLKAAVAATVADLRAPNPAAGTGEPSRLDRYRADLARVVRPRRTDDMPVTERPAPLVLVSEQRIDRPAASDSNAVGRVMPRRISSGNLALEDDSDDTDDFVPSPDAENIFASSKNFAEFAERLGASDLPDLLEAAAAYTACIEGRPHFSRPHLMRHVAAVAEDSDLMREDSMRSFGQLLRQGKIEKVRRGQFAITDSSYFLAEARRLTR